MNETEILSPPSASAGRVRKPMLGKPILRKPKVAKERTRLTRGEIAVMAVLSILVIVVAFPVIFALANSFRSYADITRDPMGLPTSFSLDNYVRLFQTTDYGEAVINTLIITGGTLVLRTEARNKDEK